MLKHFKKLDNKHLLIFSLAATGIILFIITRILFLDSDLPPFFISTYSGFDEMKYVLPAFNFYENGFWRNPGFNYLPSDFYNTNNWVENIITFFTFQIFGENYYGLRIAPVLASFVIVLITVWFIYTLISKNNKENTDNYVNSKNSQLLLTGFFLFIILEFSFLVASRVNEPTIYSMMAMMALLYIAQFMFKDEKPATHTKAFLLGLFSMAGVLFFYITNLFVIPAFGLFVLYIGLRKKFVTGITFGFSFLLGVALAFVVFLLTFKMIVGQGYFDYNMPFFLNPEFASRSNLHDITSLHQLIYRIIRSIAAFLKTNIFRLNMSFLILFLFSLPIYINKILLKRRPVDILVFSLFVFLFIQASMMIDFSFRKLTIVFPVAVIIVASAFLHLKEFLNNINKNKRLKRIMNLYIYSFFLCITVVWVMHLIHVYHSFKHNVLDNITIISNCIAILFFSILIKTLIENKISVKVFYRCAFCFLLSLSIYLDAKYIFINPTFKYRDTMKEISHIVDGKKLVGGFSLGARLYNNADTFLNPSRYSPFLQGEMEYWDAMKIIIKKGDVDYTLSSLEDRDILEELGFDLKGIYIMEEVYGKVGLFKYNNEKAGSLVN
jgi:hypothetical protein